MSDLRREQKDLQTEVIERKRAEQALRQEHDELESRVAERTSDLERINAQLNEEIEERRCVEVALRASEARFKNIFTASHDPIFVIDPSDDRILDANPQACDLLKYSRDELLSVAMSDIHKHNPTELQTFVQSVFEHGHGWTAELTCRDKTGTLIPVEISATAMAMDGQTCMVAAVRNITERRELQETIQENLHRFEDVLATAPEAIISVDETQRILNFNQGAAHIFGYTSEEVLGQPLTMLLPEAARAAHHQQVLTFAGSTDDSRQMGERKEISGQRKSGEGFPAEASISKVQVHGQWIFTAILRDITARRKIEQRLAVEHAVATILATGTAFTHVAPRILQSVCTILEWRFGALWQLDVEADLMRHVGLWHDKTVDRSAFVDMTRTLTFARGNSLVGRVMSTRQPVWIRDVAAEPSFPRAAVAERVGLHAAFAFPITIGETIYGVMEFFHDQVQDPDEGLLRVVEVLGSQMGQFAERMRIEEVLSYTQFAIDHAVDPTFFIREDGSFFYVNDAMCCALGYSREELLSLRVPDIDPDFPRDAWADHWREMRDRRIATFESRHRTKDGRVFPVEITVNHLEFQGTEYNCVFARNITERKQTEDRFRQTQKMEAIGQLAGGIAHDFNNVLSAIFGYSQLVEREVPEDSALREHIGQVLIAAGRAKDLVKQILAFSRQSEYVPTLLTVGPIIEEVLALLRASLPSTIEIRPTLDPTDGIIMADSTEIHQVIMNLCTNAEHAMRGQTGVLEIGLRRVTLDAHIAARRGVSEGRYVELRISDTGHGMPLEVRERIFELFFTTKGIGEGTGLGLSVLHGIVTQCGGSITVESAVGQGTTFVILFPQVEAQQEDRVAPSADAILPGTECILFVDDEPMLVQMSQTMLTQYGYTVVGRTSSIEALELFRHAPDRFDVVVTDQTMPHMTGADLANEMLKLRPDIPIIVCTGYSAMISPTIAKGMGIREVVMKPLIIADLARIIRKLCD